ncbi:hypothetical protein FN846DRAFT_886217 [Sphaerosporella brunnea]|uniref:Uncharacterized protein n=1 Tax=Sphaerosporella brunnea TaxID=1250544 RepID=A0A5J5FAS1_9PEZI|nr:hypothetical protein FN846DRAFT_886217 [Sphaerosporella brunnea]
MNLGATITTSDAVRCHGFTFTYKQEPPSHIPSVVVFSRDIDLQADDAVGVFLVGDDGPNGGLPPTAHVAPQLRGVILPKAHDVNQTFDGVDRPGPFVVQHHGHREQVVRQPANVGLRLGVVEKAEPEAPDLERPLDPEPTADDEDLEGPPLDPELPAVPEDADLGRALDLMPTAEDADIR